MVETVGFCANVPAGPISHQWARELKRSGIRNYIAIDFKIANEERVWFGHYNEKHQHLPLRDAIRRLLKMDNKLGYELFIDRKIAPHEILRIRHIPKPMGWRYEPEAHGKRPCPCPMCIQRGGYKTSKLKEKDEKLSRLEAKAIILNSNDDELWGAVMSLQGKRRKESPQYLERLLHSTDEYLLYDLVKLIAEYRHPLAKDYLRILATSQDNEVSELALEFLQEKNKN